MYIYLVIERYFKLTCTNKIRPVLLFLESHGSYDWIIEIDVEYELWE
jgi:hypothetical protein